MHAHVLVRAPGPSQFRGTEQPQSICCCCCCCCFLCCPSATPRPRCVLLLPPPGWCWCLLCRADGCSGARAGSVSGGDGHLWRCLCSACAGAATAGGSASSACACASACAASGGGTTPWCGLLPLLLLLLLPPVRPVPADCGPGFCLAVSPWPQFSSATSIDSHIISQ